MNGWRVESEGVCGLSLGGYIYIPFLLFFLLFYLLFLWVGEGVLAEGSMLCVILCVAAYDERMKRMSVAL